jgi:hypothetical protein
MELGFCLSKSWKTLICSLKDRRKPPQHDGEFGFSTRPHKYLHTRRSWCPDLFLHTQPLATDLSLTSLFPARHVLKNSSHPPCTQPALFRVRHPVLVSYWLGGLVHGCWWLHWTSQCEPSSIFHVPSVSYIYPSFPAHSLFCLPPAYLLVLAEIFFDPEDGGDMFLRNVGCISTDYIASHPRRWYSSVKITTLHIWSCWCKSTRDGY